MLIIWPTIGLEKYDFCLRGIGHKKRLALGPVRLSCPDLFRLVFSHRILLNQPKSAGFRISRTPPNALPSPHPHPLVLPSPWFLFLSSAPFRIHGGADGCAVSSLTAYLHHRRSSRKRHQGGTFNLILMGSPSSTPTISTTPHQRCWGSSTPLLISRSCCRACGRIVNM